MGSMIKSRNRFICLFLLFCIVPLVCYAEPLSDELELPEIFNRLQRAADETHSLSSDFVQEKHLAIFAETLISQGLFFYRQPDHLRWELLSPVLSGFVLRGQKGERWNGLSKETESFRIDRDPIMSIIAQQLLAWAKVDIDWLKSRYRIELLSAQPVRLQLFPRDQGEAGFIDRLQIIFSVNNSHVEQVEMHEVGGDRTLLRFENAQINQPLPVEAFQAPEL
jgi:outer membrane lipoprotein-sorting protein